jgi:iron complex outermembrane receptor protein
VSAAVHRREYSARVGLRAGCVSIVCGATVADIAGSQTLQDRRLTDLSLEELIQVEITSVSKRPERLSDAATSVFVISAADVRRSGATSLAEALRLAPNLQVVRAFNQGHTVSARGFSSSSANKLLVLIDGRSVYSPLFSGVFWDVQEVMLEDIERIEVISGPGSALWGVNAVNGVINVITRSAVNTQGGLVSAATSRHESRANARYGAPLGGGGAWRLYGQRAEFRDTETADGVRVDDSGHLTQIGWRADAQRGVDRFTLHAQAYRGRRDQPEPGTISISGVQLDLGPITMSGAHVLGRWERQLGGGSSLQVQGYYDRTKRDVIPTFSDTQDIVDLQVQHTVAPLGAHQFVWGAQYRAGRDRLGNSVYVAFLPARLDQTWVSLFAQDEIELADALRLTLGARAERNSYTGTEFLPTARLAWKWAPDQLLWMAASRTVRAPSRLDRDTFVPGQPPFLLRGGPDVQAETARVYELGYRGRPTPQTTFSATVFHADYDRLRTQQIDPTFTYIYFANGMQGSTSGLELWGSWQLRPHWRLHAGYSRLRQNLRLKPWSNDADAVAATEGANPSQWWQLRSAFDLGDGVELDLGLRHVGTLALPRVPRYTTLDVRVGWRPFAGLELSITGRNLTGGGHGEFTDVSTRTEFGPAVFAKAEWQF